MNNLDLQTMESNAEQAEALLAQLANRRRLLVLCKLIGGEQTVSQLLLGSSLSQSALSQHLAKLREAGVVEARREGQNAYYSIASQPARTLIETLCGLYKSQILRSTDPNSEPSTK